MTRGSANAAFTTALAFAGLFVACDRPPSPTNPSSPAGQPSPSRVEIVGPPTVAPGQTAQFTVTGHFADGSTRDVTGEARWTAPNSGVLIVSASGVATGLALGEADLSVSVPRPGLSAVSSVRAVMVIPAGTYRLSGVVRSSRAGPVPEGRVEVMTGPVQGQFARTDNEGRYRLYGVSGPTAIRVTSPGYRSHDQTVIVNDHQIVDVTLTFTGPDVSGTYTLGITADDNCAAQLPEAARTRTYTAVVAQDGPLVNVRLSGAKFAALPGGRGSHFQGRIGGQYVHFYLSLDPGYAYGPYLETEVAEELAPGYLVVAGVASTGFGSEGLASGLLFGAMLLVGDPYRLAPELAACRSRYAPARGHRFVFSR